METEKSTVDASLALLGEERLKLEREALAIERERLAAARQRAEAEAAMEVKRHHPFLVVSSVVLLALVSFAGGLLAGMTIMETRAQAQREVRLARALSQLDSFAGGSVTNAAALPKGIGDKTPHAAHRNVAVMVIQ